ncbi:helix-turn-helix transcriptional regulator [Paraconexibacter sp. AEG42_29]|uniref:helix-turn-helix transcriptional regulator n=1 Tax=Paraconexibacter sp. AEG42_29 TaxID=2997339 RepID=UPI00339D5852
MDVKDLIPSYERLSALEDLDDLLTVAAEVAADTLGFDRAVVAAVADGRVGRVVGASPAGEELRAGLLAGRTRLWTDDDSGGPPVLPTTLPPGLRPGLGLGRHIWAWVAPDDRPLALLIADGRAAPIRAGDRTAARNVAAVVGIAVERVVLRRRSRAFAADVSAFGVLARGMSREVLDGEPTLPAGPDSGRDAMAALPDVALLARLTPQERRVAVLLGEGRTNAAIGELLLLAPDTVKAHVGRIRRKLGASTRVEAIALLLGTPRA